MNQFEKTLKSEKFAIDIIAKFLKIDRGCFFHNTRYKGDSCVDFTIWGMKFDVKYSNPVFINKNKMKKIWDFDLRNKTNYCDMIVLVGMKKSVPVSVFFVPENKTPKRHIRVSIKGFSKWHSYRIWNNKM